MIHLRTLADLSADDVREILELSRDLEAEVRGGRRNPRLAGRVLVQVFEKPSLRTRASFEAAMGQLGGSSQFFLGQDAGFNGREALADVARVLSGYADAIVLRTYSQQLIEDFAGHSRSPVINGLSDDVHPCQALTDVFTMQEEFGPDLSARKVVFVGDGNNVSRSLARISAMLGIPFTLCGPSDYHLPERDVQRLRKEYPSATLEQTDDVDAALAGAEVVYTDVWASMGQEREKAAREKAFQPYQVNAAVMARAGRDARFMHDLPARRGLEVTDDVIDGPQSIAFRQAENRMHVAKGLLVWLIEKTS